MSYIYDFAIYMRFCRGLVMSMRRKMGMQNTHLNVAY